MANAALFAEARLQLSDALGALRAAKNRLITSPVSIVDAAGTVLRIVGTMAQNAPTPDLQKSWLAQYKILQPKVATLRAQLSSGAPSELVAEIGKFYDAVTTFGGQVLEGAGGVIQAAPQVIKSAPWILALVIVVLAVVVVMVGPQLAKTYGGSK